MLRVGIIVVLGAVTVSTASVIFAQKHDAPDTAHIQRDMRNVIARDGSFIKTSSGIIYDTNTDLQWYPGPNEDTSWHEARKWTDNLTVDDGSWRMPTLAELKTLYMDNHGNRNMSKLFNMTGWWVWSGEKVGEIAGCFYFVDGENHSDFVFYSGKFRGFAVRHRK